MKLFNTFMRGDIGKTEVFADFQGECNAMEERMIELIRLSLMSISEDDDYALKLREFVIRYLRYRAGSIPVIMVMVKPDPAWTHEYIGLDIFAYYIEQTDLCFDNPDHACYVATGIVAPLVIGFERDIGFWATTRDHVQRYVLSMLCATAVLLETL